MGKQILSIVSILLFGFSIGLAQTPTEELKTISGGVLNGKAQILAKPAYPAAAKAVGAEGAVNVQVVIDENGDVVSATAVSGHPLLRQAAETAARESKFKPTTLSGQAVRVSGIIVYNFVAGNSAMEKPTWFKVGYDLASVQHASSLIFLNTNAISKVFQADWTAENEQLKKLAEIKQAESSSNFPPEIIGERKVSENTEKKSDGTTLKTVIIERAIKADNQTNSEQIAISQSLIAALQSRLGGNELDLWQFNTGLSLSQALSKLRYTNERQRVLDSLRQQIQSAPNGVSAEYLADLQKIAVILEKPNQTEDDRQQIGSILRRLFKNQ